MAEFEVTGPDGNKYRVTAPDDATDEQILSYVQSNAGTASGDAPAPAGKPLSAGERFMQGLTAPFKALTQMQSHAMGDVQPEAVPGAEFQPIPKPAQMDKEIQRDEAAYQARRQAAGEDGIDWWRLAGTVAGSAPIAAVLPAPASLPGAIAGGAATGALSGVLEPATDPNKSFLSQKGRQAGIGTITGAVTGPLAYGASRLLSPRPSEEVSKLMAEGITPTPGQAIGPRAARLEEKISSWPVVGGFARAARSRGVEDFNEAAANRALAPIGQKLESKVGRDAIEEVGTKLGNAYEEILPKLTFSVDEQFAQDMSAITQQAMETLDPADARRMSSLLKSKFVRHLQDGQMDGRAYKQAWSELSRLASEFSSDASADKRLLGESLTDSLGAIRSALQRANPDFAPQLSKIDEGWAIFTRLRRAASSVGAEGGVFTPEQLQSAVKAADKSAGKGAFARGDALLQDLSETAKKVMGSKVPNSGTADRLLAPGSIATALSAGQFGLLDPTTAALTGAALLPYTRAGQKVTANLLAGPRPELLQRLAPAVNAAGLPLSVGVTHGLLSPQ